ncbi:2-oxoglutarate dehydrogenase E1 component [Undibacterium sp.]|jgi:2-oxoglutarate dehydrogenase E1 component|uniref:2-oxoglutarate dehydrogenase E1 component n=1 Tax=Undibacterium sp. TaxID=1914977 RepID=UPI002C5B2475|nr:2-oxoglutarate dehydrogenase E1 component [Undibacterium sp.]HTD03956.1 2-oxoglutarate dehydrogenase E1 component [Undibacterium sp.]
MMTQNRRTSFLYGENVPYIEGLYEMYLSDPSTVTPEWHSYFEALQGVPAVDGSDKDDVAHAPVVDRFVELAKRTRPTVIAGDALQLAKKQVAVQSLIAAYRMVGTRGAFLDPLQWTPTPHVPDLTPAFYGLSAADMATNFSTADTYFWERDTATLKDLVDALEDTYCGTLGAEYMYLADAAQRQWWQMRLESTRSRPSLSAEHRRHILERLTAAEGLERYLHTRYVGQKRFSLEGGEALIVLLDELISVGASQGLKSVVVGMAHRGRLNVLVNTVGKPPQALFDEFDGKTAHLLPAGDVKYHKGFTGTMETQHGPVEIVLAFNASHLEIVNPVVQGIARARAEKLGNIGDGAVMPVEIHGDVAISGQGIVMETMNLGSTKGHGTGGTVHIVVNNQIGFTTSDPSETRSTFYCTDIAKMIEAPVLHVNGDDPEAVVAAVRLAVEYRTTFQKSVVIDLVCFRRHGHQEQDTPNITQPLMYRSIAGHPGVRAIYAKKLVDDKVVTSEQVDDYGNAYRNRLANARAEAIPAARAVLGSDKGAKKSKNNAAATGYMPPSREEVVALAHKITEVPDNYSLHPLVTKMITGRREMADDTKPIDWGMGEHLAFASLLASGIDVRISGQDSERGTFSHRHAVLNNQNRMARGEGRYIPLDHLSADQGRFTVNNSVLSEAAVLAFEYGYTTVKEDALVIWEAQFGDFANGAQVVIDNFIVAGESKWGQTSGLTMFLPHGQEGAGPEHASARLERYLQLCAQQNIQVCQPTTPGQIFHLLRRQATLHERRPLIVMTPKSLLRHPEAVSSLDQLASGEFKAVLGDSEVSAAVYGDIEQVIACSGKIYFELLEYRRAKGISNAAIIRLEQLYPFPAEQLASELALYKNVHTVAWCQEEARNQGAWKVIEEDLRAVTPVNATLRDSTRPAMASTAPGYSSMHTAQQAALVAGAFVY